MDAKHQRVILLIRKKKKKRNKGYNKGNYVVRILKKKRTVRDKIQ